jgi:hypothetical protein
MAHALDDTDKLLARATAAIAESVRLLEENLSWQMNIRGGLRLMRLRANFKPKAHRLLSPLDFS